MEEMTIVSEYIVRQSMLAETLARLAISGPIGYNKAVAIVKKLATTDEGIKALKDAASYAESHIFQYNQSNLQFLRSRALSGAYVAGDESKSATPYGLAIRTSQLSTTAARNYVNRFTFGIEKTF
jgi:hypothetical protein